MRHDHNEDGNSKTTIVIITMVMMSIYSKPSARSLDCFSNRTELTRLLYYIDIEQSAKHAHCSDSATQQNRIS